ncbi:hypothetical protein JW979_09565, partial [bacterium]|nr:hypothetical protein [candidate division CSSED10-310 bacterium]
MPVNSKGRSIMMTSAGLFLISAAVLLIEIVQMRVFSLALWHHLAYLVITIALLGFGVSGTIIAIFPEFFRKNMPVVLIYGSIFFAGSTFIAFWITSHERLDTFKLLTPSGLQFSQLFLLFLYYAVFIVPFVAAGGVIACIFTCHSRNAFSLYFANLSG